MIVLQKFSQLQEPVTVDNQVPQLVFKDFSRRCIQNVIINS